MITVPYLHWVSAYIKSMNGCANIFFSLMQKWLFSVPKMKGQRSVISLTLLQTTHKARNLGVIIESDLNFNNHIKLIAKSAYNHLKNIARINGFLCKEDIEKLVLAIIFSRLDYCNGVFTGLNKNQLDNYCWSRMLKQEESKHQKNWHYYTSRQINELASCVSKDKLQNFSIGLQSTKWSRTKIYSRFINSIWSIKPPGAIRDRSTLFSQSPNQTKRSSFQLSCSLPVEQSPCTPEVCSKINSFKSGLKTLLLVAALT